MTPRRAKDVTLVLHVGLHKTATTYLQGLWSAHRAELLDAGVLYPTTGIPVGDRPRTREGAQSGHTLFARPRVRHRALRAALLEELPASVSTVLISSEEFGRPTGGPTPDQLLARFSGFGGVKVVLVLRRQDAWVESYYKQIVDQYANRETRSLDEFVRDRGPELLDYHARFARWRDLVGAENFHALSYDDLREGAAISRRVLEVAGVRGPVHDRLAAFTPPRYDSVRGIDTLGLRILNAYRFEDRDLRTRVARSIYDLAPAGDLELMSADTRREIRELCEPVNERIEAEWFAEPVPGLRFGAAPRAAATPPTGSEVFDYVGRVISACEAARPSPTDADASGAAGADPDTSRQ
ncbi:hypothetical protein [Nocardioides sp. YIM 152588]|uniref:hypothetical protein n=1 Tax=Nocardioides sp. YIM 152588 TaxID=3158259 RepID=UPI0032E394B7